MAGKHHSDLRFCGCCQCWSGLHSRRGKFYAKYARRAYRRLVKLLCKQAIHNPEIDIPKRFSVPYTD